MSLKLQCACYTHSTSSLGQVTFQVPGSHQMWLTVTAFYRNNLETKASTAADAGAIK